MTHELESLRHLPLEIPSPESPLMSPVLPPLPSQVVMRGLRPKFPAHAPPAFIQLAQSCWSGSPQMRPTFEEALVMLSNMLIVSVNDVGGGSYKCTDHLWH